MHTKTYKDFEWLQKGLCMRKNEREVDRKQDKATLRAKILSEYDNPSTKVYKLVDDIEELKNEASFLIALIMSVTCAPGLHSFMIKQTLNVLFRFWFRRN